MMDGNEPATRLPIIVFINKINIIPWVLPVPVCDGAFSSTEFDWPELNMSGTNMNNAINAAIKEIIIPVIVVMCPAAIIVCVLASSPFLRLNESIKNTMASRNRILPKKSHQVLLKFSEDTKTIMGIQKSIAANIPKVR